MLRTLNELGEPFSRFGGEIMMVRRADLKRVLAFGMQRYGGTKLQTNATLIEETDLTLFRDYAVQVGVSIDGPAGLNDAHWAGTLTATRRATVRTEAVIETLCREGTPPGIVITLHRLNAQGARPDILVDWLLFLDELGVRRISMICWKPITWRSEPISSSLRRKTSLFCAACERSSAN
jgi:uncharacterized protein